MRLFSRSLLILALFFLFSFSVSADTYSYDQELTYTGYSGELHTYTFSYEEDEFISSICPVLLSGLEHPRQTIYILLDGVTHTLDFFLEENGVAYWKDVDSDLVFYSLFVDDYFYTQLLLSDYIGEAINITVSSAPFSSDRTFFSDLVSVSSTSLQLVSSISSTIVSNPFLLLVFGFFFAGALVGVFGRILYL